MDNKRIHVFDTTLRDGEQSPGASLTPKEKCEIARQLERLNVDVIEAGFPASSGGEIEAIQGVSRGVRKPVICGLARAIRSDIDAARKALRYAKRRRIHVFLATSQIHREYKLRKGKGEVLALAERHIKYAKKFFDDIQFSPEDASRTEPDFLLEMVETAIAAGATTINIPDTVGYAIPQEFGRLIRLLIERIPVLGKDVTLAVHCHNDLGLATANSLEAVRSGANQVECTINGIGERAGNASLEEIVMAIDTRQDLFGACTNVKLNEIVKASRLVSMMTGIPVQPNKAIVGRNAFSHEAGIHQDGVLKKRQTYEIIDPKCIGLSGSQLVLGKHSGRHAFKERLKKLGYDLKPADMEKTFKRFKVLADQKKEVYDEDIEALLEDELSKVPETWILDYLAVNIATDRAPEATVRLRKKGKKYEAIAKGDGPVDACYKAIEKITKMKVDLRDYSLKAVSRGEDALGEVGVKVLGAGREVTGRAANTDIIQASVNAYMQAINKLCSKSVKRRSFSELRLV
ncbi:MAG: 2-isopropylmalate synthase [Candidatus Omnitrophica bacterium]|nr:2-isopropylmalate synthase [Candidatus Omnitrophota bacterium]